MASPTQPPATPLPLNGILKKVWAFETPLRKPTVAVPTTPARAHPPPPTPGSILLSRSALRSTKVSTRNAPQPQFRVFEPSSTGPQVRMRHSPRPLTNPATPLLRAPMRRPLPPRTLTAPPPVKPATPLRHRPLRHPLQLEAVERPALNVTPARRPPVVKPPRPRPSPLKKPPVRKGGGAGFGTTLGHIEEGE